MNAPAKAPAPAPMAFPTCNLEHLQEVVRWDDDAPGRVREDDLRQIVGITAKRLGFAALGSDRGITMDLGNGYALTCTVAKLPEAAR